MLDEDFRKNIVKIDWQRLYEEVYQRLERFMLSGSDSELENKIANRQVDVELINIFLLQDGLENNAYSLRLLIEFTLVLEIDIKRYFPKI